MKRILRFVVTILTVAWGRTPVVWLWTKPQTSLDLLMQVASRHYKPGWESGGLLLLSRLLYFPMLLLWPVRAIIIAAIQFRRYARTTRDKYNVTYMGQLMDLLSIGLRYWTSPQIYYLFEIYRHRDLARSRTFLLENTMTSLLPYINGSRNDRHLDEKHVFNRQMKRKGFPVLEDIGLVRDGEIVDVDGNELQLPCSDIIAKPDLGLEGRGLTGFRWLGDNRYRSSRGDLLDGEGLRRKLLEMASDEPYLLQHRSVNHPALKDLSNGMFCTCRIITGMSPEGEVEVILAVFKMPIGDTVADNFGAGGIASPVNLDNGELGRAVYKYTLFEEFDAHPDTGARINGTRLPHWRETMDLVKDAHRQVEGDFPFLGWDIGICDTGPVIVETQATFGFILCERPGLNGLGTTRFPDLYARWIDNSSYQVVAPALTE